LAPGGAPFSLSSQQLPDCADFLSFNDTLQRFLSYDGVKTAAFIALMPEIFNTPPLRERFARSPAKKNQRKYLADGSVTVMRIASSLHRRVQRECTFFTLKRLNKIP
jgi:hypothetical protein